jgi:hypothetical protein
MSLLAEYDFVAEITKNKILDLIKKNWLVDGSPAQPPFDLRFSFSRNGVTADVFLIISNMSLALEGDNFMSVTLDFERSSASITGLFVAEYLDCKGTITISQLAIALASKSPTDIFTKRIAIDFRNAAVTMTCDKAKDLLAVAKKEVELEIGKRGIQPYPPDWKMVPSLSGDPSMDGSLKDAKFIRLDIHRIDNETLGIFGILLAKNSSKGNVALKTSTAILPGKDFAMSLSPEAFHKLLFCPEVAKSLSGGDVSKLPPSCGPAEQITANGVDFTHISDSFAEGKININTTITKTLSVFKITAEGTAAAVLYFDGPQLKVKMSMERTNLTLDIPWYVRAAMLAAFLPLNGIVDYYTAEFLSALAETINSMISNLSRDIDTSKYLKNTSSYLKTIRFDNVNTTSEGLTMGGTLPVTFPLKRKRGIYLSGMVQTTSVLELGRGNYASNHCPVGSFPFVDYLKEQTAVYTAVPSLLSHPLKLNWFINSQMIPASITSGTIKIPSMRTHFPFPLPAGSYSDSPVNISYEIKGDSIILKNLPEEGGYSVLLKVQAEEPGEIAVEDFDYIEFEGHVAEIGKDFFIKSVICSLKDAPPKRRSPASDFIDLTPSIIPGRPTDLNNAIDMHNYMDSVIVSGIEEAAGIMGTAKLVNGKLFNKALFASSNDLIK